MDVFILIFKKFCAAIYIFFFERDWTLRYWLDPQPLPVADANSLELSLLLKTATAFLSFSASDPASAVLRSNKLSRKR